MLSSSPYSRRSSGDVPLGRAGADQHGDGIARHDAQQDEHDRRHAEQRRDREKQPVEEEGPGHGCSARRSGCFAGASPRDEARRGPGGDKQDHCCQLPYRERIAYGSFPDVLTHHHAGGLPRRRSMLCTCRLEHRRNNWRFRSRQHHLIPVLSENGLLPDMRNMSNQDNKVIRDAREVLRARLPDGWRTDLDKVDGAGDDKGADARLRISGPDGHSACLAVCSRRSLQPRDVLVLRAHLQHLSADNSMVVAPYLSPSVRERLVESGQGFVDLTGNVRVALSRPGLFIEANGADVNSDRSARPSRSLRRGRSWASARSSHQRPAADTNLTGSGCVEAAKVLTPRLLGVLSCSSFGVRRRESIACLRTSRNPKLQYQVRLHTPTRARPAAPAASAPPLLAAARNAPQAFDIAWGSMKLAKWPSNFRPSLYTTGWTC